MIYLCPFCGHNIIPIKNGIKSCENCNRVFDCHSYHKILFASWVVRKQNLYNKDVIQSICNLNSSEVNLVHELVVNRNLSHDELIKIVKQDNFNNYKIID